MAGVRIGELKIPYHILSQVLPISLKTRLIGKHGIRYGQHITTASSASGFRFLPAGKRNILTFSSRVKV